MRKILFVSCFLILSACSTVPDSVMLPEDVNLVSYQEVAGDPDKSTARLARWGGVIANIENQEGATLLEVVHFPLRSYGRPIPDDESIGRFRVYVNGFLDPMVYQTGRMMTFAGQVIGSEEGVVGEHQYVYPTLQADGYHLWKDYDRVEVETISVWPSFHFRHGVYGHRGWFGWHAWPYHQRVIIKRRHDHHNYNQHGNTPPPAQQNSASNDERAPTVKHPRAVENGKVDP
ncbi:MAG: Slp family lipoprotein [Aestuariibacter sp.]